MIAGNASVRPVRTALVTGAAGYIGSALVRGLLSDGVRVRALDSLLRGDAGIRALYTNPDFELIRGDVRRPEAVVRAVSGVDAVIHLAAVEGERECRRNPAAAVETNVDATDLLAEVCRGLGVARLVLASTLEVYGTGSREVDETSEPDPAGLYAATKLDAERLASAPVSQAPATVVFRLGDVFGVGALPDADLGLNRMTASLAAPAEPRSLYRTHVSDVCAVMRQALVCRAEVIAGQTFNVGAEQMRLTEAEIRALLVDFDPAPAKDEPGPVVSFAKLRARFGAGCVVSLRQGLAELTRHWRRGGAAMDPRRAPTELRASAAALAAARFVA